MFFLGKNKFWRQLPASKFWVFHWVINRKGPNLSWFLPIAYYVCQLTSSFVITHIAKVDGLLLYGNPDNAFVISFMTLLVATYYSELLDFTLLVCHFTLKGSLFFWSIFFSFLRSCMLYVCLRPGFINCSCNLLTQAMKVVGRDGKAWALINGYHMRIFPVSLFSLFWVQ